MTLHYRLLVGAAMLCALPPSQAVAQPGAARHQPVPVPLAYTGPVTDAAQVLDSAQKAALSSDLAGIAARSRRRIVVATAPRLGSADIAEYARNLVRLWAGDDGVVILLAPNERLVRIAVGSGLERTLPDAVCRQIIDEVMLPEFREGRLFEGLSHGVAALNARL